MATPKDLPQDVGGFIRDLRQTAKISLRQLADRAGVSNPYLSQIERGLRKPSAEVLQQLASALRVSTPAMYLRAGLLDSEGQLGVLAAIAADPELNIAQKQSLSQIYETFRNENVRNAPAGTPGEPGETSAETEADVLLLAEEDALVAAAAQAETDATDPAPEATPAGPAPETTPTIEESKK
jgi:transcriptional regulator with XRE-family HTH domain